MVFFRKSCLYFGKKHPYGIKSRNSLKCVCILPNKNLSVRYKRLFWLRNISNRSMSTSKIVIYLDGSFWPEPYLALRFALHMKACHSVSPWKTTIKCCPSGLNLMMYLKYRWYFNYICVYSWPNLMFLKHEKGTLLGDNACFKWIAIIIFMNITYLLVWGRLHFAGRPY